MKNPDDINGALKRLKIVITKYLNKFVTKPALETIKNNIKGQSKLASLLRLISIVNTEIHSRGIDYDKDWLISLPEQERENRIKVFKEFLESTGEPNQVIVSTVAQYLRSDNSQKYLLAYLIRELNWIAISLLSASYISAAVLMRAVFELVVGISTRKTGKMSERINSISHLEKKEKQELKQLWRRLCAWGHPYGKWIKEVCPIYYSQPSPQYHPRLFDICLREFVCLVDFFVATAISKYEVDRKRLSASLNKNGVKIAYLKLASQRLYQRHYPRAYRRDAKKRFKIR